LKDEENQDSIGKSVAGSITNDSRAVSQARQDENNLDIFLEEGDE